MDHAEYMRGWYRQKIQNPHIDKICVGCGVAFKTWRHNIRYCSKSCRRHRNFLVCKQCTSTFRVPNYRKETAKFCSTSCGSQYRKGELAANWQGGKTDYITRLRTSNRYKAWRTAVFERDNYTCVHCGDNTGGNLEADHIKPQSLYPELILDVGNGRTLCRCCHKQTDTWGRKVFNIKRQFRVAKRI